MSDMDKIKEKKTSRRHFLAGSAALSSVAVSLPTIAQGSDDDITVNTLKEAQKLFGLDFTDKENEQLLTVLGKQVENLQELRTIEKSNGLPQALTFDPRLSYVDYPERQNRLELSKSSSYVKNMTDGNIAFASIKQQAAWIKKGKITSERLTKIYLKRIQKHGPALECFVTVTEDLALQQARQADREIKAGKYRGPLHGIPYGIKDLFDTKGIKTTWGAMPYKDRVAQSDATIVEILTQAGAVMLGKTTCGALASGDVWYDGKTRNPWNLREGSTGSSAGSASATAAGLVGFSIGTETLGSIISPSNRCGITGLRPTYGRVSRAGAMALCWSLDKVGPMCRTVEDTAMVLSVLNHYDKKDSGAIEMGFDYQGNRDLSDIVVGYDPDWFEGEGTAVCDKNALQALKDLGVKTKHITLPDTKPHLLRMSLVSEAAAAHEELTLSNDDELLRRQIDRAWPNRFRHGRLLSAVDYVQLDRLRRQAMEHMQRVFEDVDMLIAPNFAAGLLVTTNYTGHPCLTLRSGFHERQLIRPGGPYLQQKDVPKEKEEAVFNLPRNISLMGRLFDEGSLCAVGHRLEEKLGVNNNPPEFMV